MASESTEERTMSVSLPTELADWLDEHAAMLDVDRETVLVQLLASYRTTAELDGDFDPENIVFEELDEQIDQQIDHQLTQQLDDQLDEQVQSLVSETLQEQAPQLIEQQVQQAVEQQVQQAVEQQVQQAVEQQVQSTVSGQINEATNTVQKQLRSRIDDVEEDYKDKINDVRNRVIQVKKETDTKAPAEHTHEELKQLSTLEGKIDSLESEIEDLREEYEETVPETEQVVAQHTERLEEMQERLQTVAWVVSDLREIHESGGGLQAVDRIKRAAAQSDIERANCENCGNGVNLALLTDPKCPHCDATVTNVEPASGWFGDPKLLVASQLESGENK